MENQLQLFNFKGNKVRAVTINDEPYFVGKDVAEILGYKRTADAIRDNVPEKFKGVGVLPTPGGKQKAIVISEAGLYKLAFKSHAKNAERFTDWVASEILPSIRKHGAYMTNEKIEEVLTDPDTIIKLATQLKQEREGRMVAERKIQQDRPKVVFADAVSVSDTPILIGELAKIIKQNGVEIGQNRLFSWLRDNGYLISRKGTDYNTPTQKAMELGLFRVKESTRVSKDGVVKITKTSKVTGKGQQYFINRFLSSTDND